MSTATLPANGSASAARGLLEPAKRAILLKLLARGLSLRSAARYVGCHPATITRTAARDPEFAQQLAEAEEALPLMALDRLTAAVNDPRNWRAAAWILERTHPERFAPRKPQAITPEQIGDVINRVLDTVSESGITMAQLTEVENRVRQLFSEAQEELWQQIEPHLELSDPAADLSQIDGPQSLEPTVESAARNAPPQSHEDLSSSQPLSHQTVT
jgi:hypothetical protein